MNTRNIKNISLIMMAVLAGTSASFAASNFSYQPAPTPKVQQPMYQQNYYPQQANQYNKNNPLQGRVITVPPGASFQGVVSTPISSEYMTMGQPVNVTLGSDFYYSGNLIAPAGSTVTGTVTQACKAKHGSRNGKLKIKFTEITTPYGARIPISAVIRTADGTGVLVGGTNKDVAKEYAKDIGVGAGAGALTGLIGSAISGGEKGKGTAIMTGIGAGAGLIKSVYDKGVDVTIPANARVELQIDQPITVNPSASSSYDY
jgi:hypothetical protein